MKQLSWKGFHGSPMSYLCIAVLGICLSCAQDDESLSPESTGNYEEQIKFLENSGFSKDEIVLENGTFIIDDDLLISAQEVDAYIARQKSEPETEHYRGTYLVSDTYVTNIKFFISSSVSSAWATAIRGAIDQWNAVNGTKLFLSEVSSSSAANTVINTAYSAENWVARAYLPSSNRRPGFQMTINTKYNSLDSGRKLFTMVHEMGHIFGFYHTNQTQGIFIQGTPRTDANSVMNSFVLPWNGFTNGDITAVQIIYPQ